MTLLSGAVPIGPADDTGSGTGFQNLTEADRAAIWEGVGGRQGIRRGLEHATVAGSMALTFTPGTAVIEERDALGNVGTDRSYVVYQRPEDGDVTVTFDAADASDRNDAVVIAAVDVEDAAFGTGVSTVGGQIVVVRGVSGTTTPRTDAQINDWLGAGAGGWVRYADVLIASTDTEINGANITVNLDAYATGFMDAFMNSNEDRAAGGGESAINFGTINEQSGGVRFASGNTQLFLASGLWDVSFQLTSENGEATANWAATLRRNSAGSPSGGTALIQGWQVIATNPRDTSVGVSRTVRVAPGDHIEVFARNNGTTGTLTVLAGNERSFITARRVGN